MTRHHNQCFVKLSQLTDNKQEPTHDHNTHSTYDANSTLPLYDALILRPHAWVGCYFDSALTLRWSSFSKHVDGTIHYLDISTNHLHVKQRTDVASGHIPNAFPSAAGAHLNLFLLILNTFLPLKDDLSAHMLRRTSTFLNFSFSFSFLVFNFLIREGVCALA